MLKIKLPTRDTLPFGTRKELGVALLYDYEFCGKKSLTEHFHYSVSTKHGTNSLLFQNEVTLSHSERSDFPRLKLTGDW